MSFLLDLFTPNSFYSYYYMFTNNILLVVVGFLWGATNPLIRRGSIGIENIKCDSTIIQMLSELKFLITRWQYLLPFALNQCGSLLYVFALKYSDLTMAVPITNSLSFVFTAISALLLGEQRSSMRTYFGMMLVILGTTICLSQQQQQEQQIK